MTRELGIRRQKAEAHQWVMFIPFYLLANHFQMASCEGNGLCPSPLSRFAPCYVKAYAVRKRHWAIADGGDTSSLQCPNHLPSRWGSKDNSSALWQSNSEHGHEPERAVLSGSDAAGVSGHRLCLTALRGSSWHTASPSFHGNWLL